MDSVTKFAVVTLKLHA